MNKSFVYDSYGDINPSEASLINFLVGDNFSYKFAEIVNFSELEKMLNEEGELVFLKVSDREDRILDSKIFKFKEGVIRLSYTKNKVFTYTKTIKKKELNISNISVLIYALNEKTLFDIKDLIEPKIEQRVKTDEFGKINILIEESRSLDLTTIEQSQGEIEYDNYQPDFKEKAAELIKVCSEGTKGIVLLHGLPGTGKSTFLKNLAKEVSNKKFIFIPPSFSHVLSNPDFMAFMLNHKDSILIIEDAETVLKTRKGSENHAVSNILNLTDGLLSDLLGLQIICTLNCNVNLIDEAVRRPGRLIFEYDFKKLDIEQCNKLLAKLYEDKEYKTTKELTIAEIYNFEKLKPEEKKRIGFNG